MFVVEKLKLNKFVHVEIPNNSDFFYRLSGARPVAPENAYTGDEYMPNSMNKVDMLAAADRVNMNQLRQEAAEARNQDAKGN